MTDRADELTRRWTAWPSFRAMLESVDDPAYVPTLQGPPGRSKAATQEREEMTELADLYDQAQAAKGDARRAYRRSPTDPETADLLRLLDNRSQEAREGRISSLPEVADRLKSGLS